MDKLRLEKMRICKMKNVETYGKKKEERIIAKRNVLNFNNVIFHIQY